MYTRLPSICLVLLAISALAACGSRSQIPYTSFQTPTAYEPTNDIRADAVILYSEDAARTKSWRDKGYIVQTMYGFRTGNDYIKDHRYEVQTTADGTLHTCGPGSYYMVPTPRRIKAAVDYFTAAIDAGTTAVIPEEPEFFSFTGYSESFKKTWQEHYKEPWQDPASSVEARYKSERLKAKMEYDMVKAILDSAQKQKPSVRRMVACHSPVSYFAWGIIYPHYQCMMIPSLQEIIGQVWTGTARTACRYAGEQIERTFENALLEYSSLYNLTRGTGKRMWFLMDPLEDNPDRSMEDYHSNYVKTLVAALMFPGVDAYEVMPWPTRIYGRVPDDYATTIGGIINALGDMHNHKEVHFDTGTRSIATFVADSMGWQRGAPHASDFDCFYGLTLPLVMKGIPIQVAQLERSPDPGYLDAYKVILISYDIMKPMKPEYNQAIADWVKRGGTLVSFGGTDPYNALPQWWRKRGFDSPMADLHARLGVKGRVRTTAFERGIGKGVLMHTATQPSHFASSMEAANELRSIAKRACDTAGLAYREQDRLGIRRGPYVAVRTFDGQKRLAGSYVNLLDHALPVVANPLIEPRSLAFYYDVTSQLKGAPKLLYATSKLESKRYLPESLTLRLSGPLKTKGTARVYTGGKAIESVQPESVTVEQSGDTALLTFDNSPDGIEIEINWIRSVAN